METIDSGNIEARIKLFFTALLQVSMVAMNVTFISKGYIYLMLITGFLISLFWTFNVRQVVFGGWKDRIIYSVGAMGGTGMGYFIAKYRSEEHTSELQSH